LFHSFGRRLVVRHEPGDGAQRICPGCMSRRPRRPFAAAWPRLRAAKRRACMCMWRSRPPTPSATKPTWGDVESGRGELEPITFSTSRSTSGRKRRAHRGTGQGAGGVQLKTEVFATARESWQHMRCNRCIPCRNLAKDLGVEAAPHLAGQVAGQPCALGPDAESAQVSGRRLEHWWHRVSEWPAHRTAREK